MECELLHTIVRRHLTSRRAISNLVDVLGILPRPTRRRVHEVLGRTDRPSTRLQAELAGQVRIERRTKVLEEKLAFSETRSH